METGGPSTTRFFTMKINVIWVDVISTTFIEYSSELNSDSKISSLILVQFRSDPHHKVSMMIRMLENAAKK